MLINNLIAKTFFILLCVISCSFSKSAEQSIPLLPTEKIEFPLKNEWLEKRYTKRDENSKVKLFFIVHNLGLNYATTTKILKILPKNISISLTPYVKQRKNTLKIIKQKGYDVLWIQPMELYRQPNTVSDPYRLSRYKDHKYNLESVINTLSDMPGSTVGVIADETSPVLRDEEALSTLLLELKKRNLPLLSPEMSVNSEFMDLCHTHGVKCEEADYAISRNHTPSDVISLLNRVKELGEQTGYAICVIDAHWPYVVTLLEWCSRLDKKQFELYPYSMD